MPELFSTAGLAEYFTARQTPRKERYAGMLRLFDLPYGNRPDYEGGVLVRECAELHESFFAQRRKK